MKKIILLFTILFLTSCSENKPDNQNSPETSVASTTVIDLWNGNRSEIRQEYEREMLEEILKATEPEFGSWEIQEDLTEYPGMEEATVFNEKGHHLFVTIAGNQKFGEDDMIVISRPLAKNLLGYRVPIIREEDAGRFSSIQNPEDLQQLEHGIPSDWSDATIFRHNGYNVVEDGNFDDIFDRLEDGLFDYSAYGANEVQGVFENRASKRNGLMIEPNILLFYPFPLVFYVNPDMPELAERVDLGLQKMVESGALDNIFDKYYGDIVNELNLDQRELFILENPLIPEEFADLEPDLTGL